LPALVALFRDKRADGSSGPRPRRPAIEHLCRRALGEALKPDASQRFQRRLLLRRRRACGPDASALTCSGCMIIAVQSQADLSSIVHAAMSGTHHMAVERHHAVVQIVAQFGHVDELGFAARGVELAQLALEVDLGGRHDHLLVDVFSIDHASTTGCRDNPPQVTALTGCSMTRQSDHAVVKNFATIVT
jgi:hypothetical protein